MKRLELLSLCLGEIVVRIPAAWEILERERSDFSYWGSLTLEEWSDKNKLDASKIADEILAQQTATQSRWTRERSLTVICDHVFKEYHYPQRQQIVQIQDLLTLTGNEVGILPAFSELEKRYRSFFYDLQKHFDYEESELFVELREIDIFHPTEPAQAGRMQFGQISQLIRNWEDEHNQACRTAEKLLVDLQEIGQSLPSSENLRKLIQSGYRFFGDLRRHVHFENFVLLPACMRVEQALCL